MGVMVNSCKPSAGEEGTRVPGAHWPPAQPGHPKLVRDTVSINKVGGVWGPPPEVVLRPCIHVHTFVPALGSTPKITSKENSVSHHSSHLRLPSPLLSPSSTWTVSTVTPEESSGHVALAAFPVPACPDILLCVALRHNGAIQVSPHRQRWPATMECTHSGNPGLILPLPKAQPPCCLPAVRHDTLSSPRPAGAKRES